MKLVRVAYQGEPGAFSEDAILKFFGPDGTVPLPQRTFADVTGAVCEGRADYAVLPIRNAITGAIVESEGAIARSCLRAAGEVVVPVEQCLLGAPGARLRDLSRVMSHPVALAQCAKFFSAHQEVTALAVDDTAGAARQAAQLRDRGVAAIASRRAGQLYGLELLAAGIQDRADNETRFLVLVGQNREFGG